MGRNAHDYSVVRGGGTAYPAGVPGVRVAQF